MILKKIYKNYNEGGIYRVLRKIYNTIFFQLLIFISFIKIKKNNFTIKFPYDANIILKMPSIEIKDFYKKKDLFIAYKSFSERPHREIGLRSLVNYMIESNSMKSGSIIDIGAWLSDNAIV